MHTSWTLDGDDSRLDADLDCIAFELVSVLRGYPISAHIVVFSTKVRRALSPPSPTPIQGRILLTTLRDRKGLFRMNVLHIGFSSLGVVAEKGIPLVAVQPHKN